MEKATLQKVYEDMKHGVYNFTKDGKCTKCGNCCTALLPVTKQELKEGIKAHLIKNDIFKTNLICAMLTVRWRASIMTLRSLLYLTSNTVVAALNVRVRN